ncbi:MAG: hypothetical protein JSU94_16510 [Phycisphaerales bacterium]|nr:MAG: hypothetical protein JSU94_16510 [Phycisphaerales bacterium]
MADLEDKLSSVLGQTGGFDNEKAQAFKREVSNMFDERLKKYRRLTWICLIVFALVTVGAIEVMVFASSTKILIVCAVIILGVGQLEVLMKLWYWIMNCKLKVLKEVKNLELQIAELQAERTEGPQSQGKT